MVDNERGDEGKEDLERVIQVMVVHLDIGRTRLSKQGRN